jgi:hypothetical protein
MARVRQFLLAVRTGARGTPAAFVGAVLAPDEKEAIKAAIIEFEIDPAQQKRLLAQRDELP